MCSKVNTRLALARLRLQSTKRQSQLKPQRKEIAKLLDEGKEVTARALTEQLIRDEKSIQAYSQLDIFCEQFLARLDAITRETNMPKDLVVCLCSLVYAAPRVDVEELKKVAANLELKYGTLWADSCHSNLHGQVHPQVFSNLGIGRSSAAMVDEYMIKIAKEHEIDWRPLIPTPTEQELESTYRAAKGLSSTQSIASPKVMHAANATNLTNQHFSSPMQSHPSTSNQHPNQQHLYKGTHHVEPSAPFHDEMQTSSASHYQQFSSNQVTLSGKSIERSSSPPIEFLRLNGFVGGSSVEEELVMIDMLPNVPDNMAVSMDRVPVASEGGVIVTHEDDDDDDDGLETVEKGKHGFNDGDDTSETFNYNDSSISITDEDIYDEIITWEDIPDGPVFASTSAPPPVSSSSNVTQSSSSQNASRGSTNNNSNSSFGEDPLLARFNRLKNSF